MKKTTFLLLFATTTIGCAEKMDSSDVRTSGIRAVFEVTAYGGDSNDSTLARAELWGGSDPLRLTGEDYLEVTEVGGETKRMTRTNTDDWTASFDTKAADTEFVFSFMRGPDDTDAPDSHVSLPPPFVVKGIENHGEVQDNGQVRISRGMDVVLTWDESPTDDTINYGIGNGSDCLWFENKSTNTKNNGSITIPASTFRAKAGQEDETCGAALYVELERVGERDPAYKSGTVRGRQRYWINFVSVP